MIKPKNYDIKNEEAIELLGKYLIENGYRHMGIIDTYQTYKNNSQNAVKIPASSEGKVEVFKQNIKEGDLEKITWLLENQEFVKTTFSPTKLINCLISQKKAQKKHLK